LIAKPHCKGFEVFSEDIAAVCLEKVMCEIDKPMYVGFCVLELSKLLMYEFHYDWVLKQYPPTLVHLLFTDTDSLVYEIDTEDIFKDMTATAANCDRFDFSNYPKDGEFYNAKNQMVVGKMKDEAEAHIITEVVALRPKMYSYKKLKSIEVELYDETKRAKGIGRAVMKDIHFDDYKAQLDEAHENHVTMYRIGHKRHHLYTFQQRKRGLCAYDDKRYLLDDGISTLAHGHYNIRELQREQRGDDDDSVRHHDSDFVSGIDEDGDEFVVLSDRAARQRPTLARLMQEDEEDEDDVNLHHIAARADEDADADDDEDVIASTVPDSDSDDDTPMRIPSLIDAEAEEGDEDEHGDNDGEGGSGAAG
jgi:hypothetical protein